MPTSTFNVGSKYKENSSMHAETYFYFKTLLIQLKEYIKSNINDLPPQQVVEGHVVVTC
jgi:hypothetical protein